MIERPAISRHARQRMAQRNISAEDIDTVLEYGVRYHCAGVIHVFLGRRNLPAERELYQRFAHLEGTVLLIRDCGSFQLLVTLYRNRRGLKSIKLKAPYDRRACLRVQRLDADAGFIDDCLRRRAVGE